MQKGEYRVMCLKEETLWRRDRVKKKEEQGKRKRMEGNIIRSWAWRTAYDRLTVLNALKD